MLDRLAFGHLQHHHDPVDALAGEDPEQRILERHVEAGAAGIALAARAAAQLIVDAPRLVALGADDVQAARFDHLVVQRLPLAAQLVGAQLLFLGRQVLDGVDQLALLLDVAAEHDVGAAARHVGGDGDHLRPAGLGDDLGFARVLLGVEHLVGELVLAEQPGKQLRVLDRSGAHQHRLAALVAVLDVADHGVVFLLGRAVHLVVPILADHVHVRRDHHRLEAVDLLELVGFGVCGAGHAGELAVHAEIVLEGDRGERLVLVLDRHVLLRLHRLVQAVRPAPSLHQPAGELVDDGHSVVLHHVMLIAMEQVMRAQRRIQVVHQVDIRRLVQARALRQHTDARQDLLGLLMPALREQDLVVLLVDPEVPGRVLLLLPGEERGDLVHAVVDLGAVLGLAGDDERRARLVDQDRIDLVDDGVMQPALEALVDVHRHVVAQIVEAELVVGPVGDVRRVGLPLVRRLHVRQVHPDAQTQEAIDLAHPVRVAARKIVVHCDDVHAGAGQGVEIRGQRRHQRLALAGLHLGDLAVVQHHAADQLHVEVAHAQRALRRLPHYCESFGQQLLQGRTFPITLL